VTRRQRIALRIALVALGLLALGVAAGGYQHPDMILHYVNLQLCS
jgi:hypothetical protein